MSTVQGEVHGIGMDDNQSSDLTHTFKLYGTQNYGNLVFNDYAPSAPNWKHYTIPIGQYNPGQMLYLFFANDHDVANPTAESYFSNVQIHDAVPTPTATFTPTNTATFTPTVTSTPTSGQTYNRIEAVNYAETQVYSRNPNYPLANNVGCNCNNCTNYLSQALHNGGYPLRPDNFSNDASEWWYNPSTLDYSYTWAAADSLRWYVLTWVTDFSTKSSISELQAGDFILMDMRENSPPFNPIPDGIPDHARVVIGEGYTSTNPNDYTDGCGVYYAVPTRVQTTLINQNCVDRRHVSWYYSMVDPDINVSLYVHVAK